MNRKAVFIFCTIIIFMVLFITEYRLRKYYGEQFGIVYDLEEYHKRRPFLNMCFLLPDGKYYYLITNSLGFRDVKPNNIIKKQTSYSKRILFLGDSFVEGYSINETDNFTHIIQLNLLKKGISVEVLNGAMCSFSPHLEYIRFKNFLKKGYRTDIVIVMPDFSDIQDEVYYTFEKRNKLIYNNIVLFFYNNFAFVRMLGIRLKPIVKKIYYSIIFNRRPILDRKIKYSDNHLINVKEFFNMDEEQITTLRYTWFMHPPSLKGWVKDGLDSCLFYLNKINELCKEYRIKLMVILYPPPTLLYTKDNPTYYAVLSKYFGKWFGYRERVFGNKPYDEITLFEKVIFDFCQKNNITLINLISEFRNLDNWHEMFHYNDIHFSVKGHRFVADKITDRLYEFLLN